MGNNNGFWDVDGSGKFDMTDIFLILFRIVVYVIGIGFMGSTFARSFHLLSSPTMNPGVFWWWPYLTAAAPEVGLLAAWLAGEVGLRKGRMDIAILSVFGFIMFGLVVGTMQMYDMEMTNGKDLTQAAEWMHLISAILPLPTIAYGAVASMALAAMDRRNDVTSGKAPQRDNWKEIIDNRPASYPETRRPALGEGKSQPALGGGGSQPGQGKHKHKHQGGGGGGSNQPRSDTRNQSGGGIQTKVQYPQPTNVSNNGGGGGGNGNGGRFSNPDEEDDDQNP